MGLERLNILVFLTNATGINPYRMILEKNRFKRFEIGWRHPTTWWMAFTMLSHLIYSFTMSTREVWNFLSSRDDEPAVYLAVMAVWHVMPTAIKLIPFLLVFHIGKLKNAVDSLVKVDQILDNISQVSCNSRRRTVVCFAVATIWITLLTLAAIPIILLQYEEHGAVLCCVLFIAEHVTQFQLAVWFIFFRLTYYNIAHRIASLKYLIGNNPFSYLATEFKQVDGYSQDESRKCRQQMGQRLQTVGFVFENLANASNQFNAVFSLPSLLVLTISFLCCTLSLFFFIDEFFHPGHLFANAKFVQLIMVSTYIILILTVVLSADLPTAEVIRLREHVTQLSTDSARFFQQNDVTEFAALLMALRENRFQLSAGGLFTVGKTLIPSLCGTVITYLVILVQSTIQKNKFNDKLETSHSSISG